MRCRSVVPFEITAAGVSGDLPAAIRPSASSCETRDAHEDDERARRLRELVEVELVVGGRAAGDDGHLRGEAAMRQRDPGRCGHGRERRHAGNDLGGDSRRRERLDLLAAAAEEERIAALQAHDRLEAPAERDEQLVDARAGADRARERREPPRGTSSSSSAGASSS